jgi:hypothetical protein
VDLLGLGWKRRQPDMATSPRPSSFQLRGVPSERPHVKRENAKRGAQGVQLEVKADKEKTVFRWRTAALPGITSSAAWKRPGCAKRPQSWRRRPRPRVTLFARPVRPSPLSPGNTTARTAGARSRTSSIPCRVRQPFRSKPQSSACAGWRICACSRVASTRRRPHKPERHSKRCFVIRQWPPTWWPFASSRVRMTVTLLNPWN